MTSEAQMNGYELLKTGRLVSFRLVKEDVLSAPADETEFGLSVELNFVSDADDEEEDEDSAGAIAGHPLCIVRVTPD